MNTNKRVLSALSGATLLFAAASAFAAGSGLPGDHGRPGDGVQSANPAPAPAPAQAPRAPEQVAPAPSIKLALEAAQAIVQACKQYKLGVTVVNAAGAPILVYIPDGSNASHAYMALRKAYTAITFNAPSSSLVTKAQTDPEIGAKVRADPNLVAYSGGILLKAGDQTVGAIGVSGAEPGHHDEECGMHGLDKIKDQLK